MFRTSGRGVPLSRKIFTIFGFLIILLIAFIMLLIFQPKSELSSNNFSIKDLSYEVDNTLRSNHDGDVYNDEVISTTVLLSNERLYRISNKIHLNDSNVTLVKSIGKWLPFKFYEICQHQRCLKAHQF